MAPTNAINDSICSNNKKHGSPFYTSPEFAILASNYESMTETSPTAAAMEQLEELIAKLVSAWLPEHPRLTSETARQEQEWIKKFSNLSLQAVYEMLGNGILTVPLATGNGISTSVVRDTLQAGDFHQLRKSYIPDQSLQRTPVRKWLDQQEKAGLSVTGRLYTVLDVHSKYWNCIEEISRATFLSSRGAGEFTWKEFVALRGY